MLKSSFKLFIIFAIIILCVAAFGIYQNQKPSFGKKIFPRKEITSFSINDIEFYKKDELWRLKDYYDYYASPEFIRSIFYVFENADYGHKSKEATKDYFKILVKDKDYFIYKNNIKTKEGHREMSVGINLYKEGYKYLANPAMNIEIEKVLSITEDEIKKRYISPKDIEEFNNTYVVEVKKEISENIEKEVIITFVDGIEMKIFCYENGWKSFEYNSLSIAKNEALKKIKSYKTLSNGWYFKFANLK